MQEIRQRQNNLNWDELIQNFQASGLSAPKWCKENGIMLSQLRWQLKKEKRLTMKKYNGSN
ncbi:IS66 family insertion sequence element accessory protein TnpA [Caloramator mitchellensis]|uniref:IS66 family insertion sequence element accessory protein TnpA n=1 Tax=Caloramator mitchellensis TaxID=908809 RepID=UPI000716F58E|nr:hypothetical protein [Caloramator mitchellensis]